jgi:hypothetical protein
MLIGGDRVDIEDGRTTRDSLIGVRLNGTRFSVPRDSVNFVETRKVDLVRSVAAGTGGLVVAGVVLSVVALLAVLSEFE